MPTLLVLVALLASHGSVELPDYEAAGDEAYTLDLELDGYVNGYMDPNRLMTVRGCTLERDAAYTYSLMVEAAEQDGIRLRPEDCYRGFRTQERAYERRCPMEVQPVYFDNGVSGAKTQVGTREVRVCSGPPIARPGRSNHGWGRAVDFRDRWNVLTCYDDEFHWLKLNAHRFGWVNPPWARCGLESQEPWHWEYAGVVERVLIRPIYLDPLLMAQIE